MTFSPVRLNHPRGRVIAPACAFILGAFLATGVAVAAEPAQLAAAAAHVTEPAYGPVAPDVIRVPTLQEISTLAANGDAITPPLEISAAEARQWVLDAGYASVSPLSLARTAEGSPVYRGTAVADGEVYAVIVDSWGNIAGWR